MKYYPLEIPTDDQAVLLLKMMCERKFGSDDIIARLSSPLNSVIRRILDQLQREDADEFDTYRARAVLAYQNDSGFHEWLRQQQQEAKVTIVEDYFLPIRALKPFDPENVKEVSDAYRG